MGNRDIIKAFINDFQPTYVIFYYVKDGEIEIFSGVKYYPSTSDEAKLGNLICKCFGEERTDEEVITAFEKWKGQ